jgi:dihydroflavonol-4-reductase
MVGTERTSHSGDYVSAYARSKHLGERAARDTATERGIDLVVVNPSSVQGPGRTSGSAELILRTLRSKRPWLVDVTASIVSLNDCVEGHRRAAVLGRTGERYILSGHSLSVAEAVETVNALVETPIEPRWVSEGLVRTLGQPLASIVALFRPGGSLCPDMIRSLLHGHRFDNAKSRDELGVVYEPLEVTFAQTIDWFRSEGLIET